MAPNIGIIVAIIPEASSIQIPTHQGSGLNTAEGRFLKGVSMQILILFVTFSPGEHLAGRTQNTAELDIQTTVSIQALNGVLQRCRQFTAVGLQLKS